MPPPKFGNIAAALLWGAGMSCLIALFAASTLSRTGVICLLALGVVAYLSAIANHGWLWNAPFPIGKPVKASLIILSVTGFMGFIGWTVFPPIRRHALDADEKKTFESYLANKNVPSYQLQIACPINDENVCAYANQFVKLFGESGWDVTPTIQRLMLAKASDGIEIVLRGGNKEYMQKHWDGGAYFPINEAHVLAVHNAFQSIAIEIDGASDPDLPENTMRIYFGPEREDESVPTDLSRDIDWVTGKITGPFPAMTKRY
jgi:hypothetical protein